MRHKEEQRRAAASLLILLIVAQAVAVAIQSSVWSTSAGDQELSTTERRAALSINLTFLLTRKK